MQTVKKFINAVRSGRSLLILTAAILVGQDLALAQLQAEGWLTTLRVALASQRGGNGTPHTARGCLEIPLVEYNNHT